MYVGHAIKTVAESDTSALNRKSCSLYKPRAILPAPTVSVSEPPKEDERKRRVLPRGLFPQPPKPKSKCVEILSQSGLHNPSVSIFRLTIAMVEKKIGARKRSSRD